MYLLADIGISAHFYRMLPYLITLIVLAFTSKNSRAPKAEGIPYERVRDRAQSKRFHFPGRDPSGEVVFSIWGTCFTLRFRDVIMAKI